MHTLTIASLALAIVAAAGLAAAIAFGGPVPLQPMQSVSDPFKSVDVSDLRVAASSNPSIEGMPKRLRLLRTTHVKR